MTRGSLAPRMPQARAGCLGAGLVPYHAPMYKLYMQLSISDARKQLPELVRRAQQGEVIEITLRGEVVARLLAPEQDAGSAAEKLLAAMGATRRRKTRRPTDVSRRKTEYLTRPAR